MKANDMTSAIEVEFIDSFDSSKITTVKLPIVRIAKARTACVYRICTKEYKYS